MCLPAPWSAEILPGSCGRTSKSDPSGAWKARTTTLGACGVSKTAKNEAAEIVAPRSFHRAGCRLDLLDPRISSREEHIRNGADARLGTVGIEDAKRPWSWRQSLFRRHRGHPGLRTDTLHGARALPGPGAARPGG